MKWALPVAFMLLAFCGRIFSALFFSLSLNGFFSWPALLLESLFDWSPMGGDHAFVLQIANWLGWGLLGFVVGAWLDLRKKQRAGNTA